MTVRPEDAVVLLRPRPQATRRLICLSYSGGGTAPFHPWAAVLSENVELVLVCYPGRELRYAEPRIKQWNALIDDMATVLAGFADRPYTLFGHSMGAWVAFEVTAGLERSGGSAPEALVVSGAESPLDWSAHRTKPPCAHDTDEQLLSWMRRVGQLPDVLADDDDLRQMALSLLRDDLRAADSYRYVPGTVVRAPIEVLFGREDPDVDARTAGRWRDLTSSDCFLTEIPGGHFYTDKLWERLPAHVGFLEGSRI